MIHVYNSGNIPVNLKNPVKLAGREVHICHCTCIAIFQCLFFSPPREISLKIYTHTTTIICLWGSAQQGIAVFISQLWVLIQGAGTVFTQVSAVTHMYMYIICATLLQCD